MRRKSFFTCAAFVISVLCQSCGLHEIGGDAASDVYHGVWGGVGIEEDNSGGFRSICYMTAMDYKADYDWRSDQAVGSVKCSLVVYSDGIPVMKVPIGDEYETSSDPDMHRMVAGHLYTDYSTDAETVVRRDGQLLFRYPGRESLLGLDAVGEDVYTLGLYRDGNGFAFRRNGEVVLERQNGNVIGSLVNDADTLCFAFYEEIWNAEGSTGRYYAAVNGKVSQVAAGDDIRNVCDIYVLKDRTVYVAMLHSASEPVIFNGMDMIHMTIPEDSRMHTCRIVEVSGSIVVEGVCRHSNGQNLNVVWVNGAIASSFADGETISAMDVHGDGISFAINPVNRSRCGKIYRNGDVYDMPEGYVVMGNGCMEMIDGILHVGLSSLEGRAPIVWKDAQMDTLEINGYISTVYSSEK